MKEKEFEVIVPAYDALESELENILGGGCNKCKPQCSVYNPVGGGCIENGNYTTSPEACCSGVSVFMGNIQICVGA